MNIVIVEDSELILTQLARIIATQPRIRVEGIASAEEAAVALILDKSPDAVLLDLSLSPGSGVRVLQRIRARGCGARVLVLTNNTDPALRAACAAHGVSGFFDKSEETERCLAQLFDWLPALPSNERERLHALWATHLLDSPEQEVFDDIAQLAREITATPIALVSLVDQDRQWFLARQGLQARETSRSIAFCAHAILDGDMLEIPDLRSDQRFQDNPLVMGDPHIRYYAGVPLVLTSGEALGTLCVLDHVPRNLTEVQKQSLKTLAHTVVSEIELRRRMHKLEQEIERRSAAEAQVMQLATRDPLTQLPNRVALQDRLAQHLRQARRHHSTLAFLFVDLDRFKLINDTLGHDMGDQALITVAARLTGALRESDTVARLGGDEFAVVLPDIGSATEALSMATRLNVALNEVAVLNGFRLHLGASIGVAMFPEHGNDADLLIRNADMAMYQAKQAGGARACVFSQELKARTRDLLALENDLRDALENGEIVAYYQPQVMLTAPTLCGAEALARWKHPQLGILGPDHFIEFAESRGFIHQIGQRMLNLALAQLRQWDAQGIHVPRVAVNVSSVELRDGFVQEVDAALALHGVSASRLELEITESTLAADGVGATSILRALRQRGISIAVDDFGVGYSSLAQLRRLPIDSLKIDKSFVGELGTNAHDAAIVSAVVTMARSLNMRTLAEGAETDSQLVALQQLGCDCVQGYVLARPMAPERFAPWAQDYLRRGLWRS